MVYTASQIVAGHLADENQTRKPCGNHPNEGGLAPASQVSKDSTTKTTSNKKRFVR